MSSFYGNGGYSSGGGGGSGEVISVNGKKGRVTLDAADVHALPEDTLIPSLDGFATEEWINNQNFLSSAYFIVEVTKNGDEYIPNCTFAEAYQAFLNGKILLYRVSRPGVLAVPASSINQSLIVFRYVSGTKELTQVSFNASGVTIITNTVALSSELPQIPSLEGFATEAWVNESINSLPKNDSTWLGGSFLGKNQFNDIEKVIIPFGSFKGEFPGVVQYEGDFNDFAFKLQHVQQTEFNLNNLGVILTIGEHEHPDYLNFYIDNEDIIIPITSIAPPNNNLRIRIAIDENNSISFESILESKVMNYFYHAGYPISKVTFVILDSFTNNQSNNTFPIEITLQQVQDHADVYRANYTVDEVNAAINQGLFTYAYIENDNQNQLYYLASNSIIGPVFAYIDSQANNISTIRFMNQYPGDNRVIIETNIPIIHSHQDISGKADKTEIIPKPVTAGTAGQVLTIDANGNPKWDNTSFVKVTDDGQGNVSMETLYGVLIDAVPTQNSNNLVTSGGVYATQSPTIDFSVSSFTNNTSVTCNMDWTQLYNTTSSHREKNIILHDIFQSFYCYKAVKTTGLGGVTISFYFLNENLNTQYIVKTTSSGNMTLLVNNLLSNYYTKTEIDNKIGNIETLLAQI